MLLTVLGFLVGVHLTITLFGALYRIIDLSFALRHFWLEITSRIAFNLTLIFLIYFFAGDGFLQGFISGQIFFALFHVGIFWCGRLIVIYRNLN